MPIRHLHARARFAPHALALAAASLLAAPALAGIITSGQVDPTPLGAVYAGHLRIGPTATGSVTVDGGSLLTVDRVTMGNGGGATTAGDGLLTVSGANSKVFSTWVNGGNLNVGGTGTGTMELLGGGSLQYGPRDANCALNCRIFVGNGAGSTGTLRVSGSGSLLDTDGVVVVGNSTVLRLASGDSEDYGQIGGRTTANARIEAGGVGTSSRLVVGQQGSGNARNGSESVVASLVVDGIGSIWGAVRNAAQVGAQALLAVAAGRNVTGSVTVSGGGAISVDGGVTPGEFSGVNIAALTSNTDASGAVGSIIVTGNGSRVVQQGGVGFTNLARGNGAQGSLSVLNGGFFGSADATANRGMTSLNIGRGGGNGTLLVDGVGSQVLLSGVNSNNNSSQPNVAGYGAFLSVGFGESGAGGVGTATISGGGRLLIDNANQANVPSNGQTGFMVGRSGATGTLTLQGNGSTMEVRAGTGTAAYTAVGRDGATGQMTVRDGGALTVTSAGTSTPNPGTTGYLPGDVGILDVGRRVGAAGGVATQGTLNITGAGAKVVMNGTRDSLFIIGRGELASGTVNITSGGSFESGGSVLVGQDSGTGSLVMNQGRMTLAGTLNGGPSAGQGVGLSIGRTGNGTMQMLNGSVVTIDSASGSPSLGVVGSTVAPGGIGTLSVAGGSSITINGPGARVEVGRTVDAGGVGLGTLTISGAGSSVVANGSNARVLLGGAAGSDGRITVGAGSLLQATSGFIGLAHDGTASTAGSARLTANGTVNAAQLTIGTQGVLGGSGTINANVTNYGTIGPGNSPGKLTINGGYDGRGGKIVLEVASNGSGGFLFDEIVFGHLAQVLLDGSSIEFDFLGDADPLAFTMAGLFGLDTFFSADNGAGGTDPLARAIFDQVSFSASADSYVFSSFSFDPSGGATVTGNAVPVPATLWLSLAALALMRVPRRRAGRHDPAAAAA